MIEDNADARETLRELLELWGLHVETAAGGEEGLERALALQPDLALIDIGLPGLDGYEVARRIRSQGDGTQGQEDAGARREVLVPNPQSAIPTPNAQRPTPSPNPQYPGPFLVALTGYGQPEDRRQAFAAGFDEHLVKPVNPEALLSLLERVRNERQPSASPAAA